MSHHSALLRMKAVAVATAAALLPAAAQAEQVFINEPIPLYAGPDMSYPIVADLYPGLGVELMGCLAGYLWCDVMLPDGQRGWVFGDSLYYPWRGNVVPVPQYGATLGIPLITFMIGDYWGRHYRQQPWYEERRWRHPPPPPPRAAPMPAPAPWGGGWQQPYPRHERETDRPPRRDREYEREPGMPHRDEGWRGAPPPRQEPAPPRGGNIAPAPAPGVAPPFQNRPDQGRPDQGRPFPPRHERIEAPRPNVTPPPAAPPSGAWNPPAAPRQERLEAPRPQREIALPPRQEREQGHGGPGNRPEGPRREP